MQDQPERKTTTRLGCNQPVEIELHLDRVGLAGELQAHCEPPDVSVYGESGKVESHGPQHVAGLASHPGQPHEVVELGGYVAVELVAHRGGHPDEALGLLAKESRRVDQHLHLGWIRIGEFVRTWKPFEQLGGDRVHHLVGALGREDGRGQELERRVVAQGAEFRSSAGIFARQPLENHGAALFRTSGSGHAGKVASDVMSLPVEAVLPARADETRLRVIDHAVQAASGHEAFPEAVWAAIADPARHPVLAIDPDGGAATVAFASDSFTPAHDQLAVGALPNVDVARIAGTVDAVVHARGEDHEFVAWIPGSDSKVIEALTVTGGFTVDRQQFQLDIVLPITETARWPAGVTVRPFVPGRDESAWLRVNNRAFANHPDQGGWIADVLERRMAEPWFDPAGFLLAWRDDDLVGFCWTKVHTEPVRQGEIFVIGVDPDAQGLGLGRALVIAGLGYLAHECRCETGILYVAADNAAAVGLYQALGFTTKRTDTALIRKAAVRS